MEKCLLKYNFFHSFLLFIKRNPEEEEKEKDFVLHFRPEIMIISILVVIKSSAHIISTANDLMDAQGFLSHVNYKIFIACWSFFTISCNFLWKSLKLVDILLRNESTIKWKFLTIYFSFGLQLVKKEVLEHNVAQISIYCRRCIFFAFIK